jgi:hypothetical protein
MPELPSNSETKHARHRSSGDLVGGLIAGTIGSVVFLTSTLDNHDGDSFSELPNATSNASNRNLNTVPNPTETLEKAD